MKEFMYFLYNGAMFIASLLMLCMTSSVCHNFFTTLGYVVVFTLIALYTLWQVALYLGSFEPDEEI